MCTLYLTLPRAWSTVRLSFAAPRQAEDAQRWKLLLGRPVSVRSVELHTYRPGGSVADPQHRDSGSLLTLSVLLSEPSSYTGAKFTYM